MANHKSLTAVDLAKFVFAILVVGIHTSPFQSYTEFGNFIFEDVIAGLAVPFFFMASCYFFFGKLQFENGKIKKVKKNAEAFKKYFLRILLLYALWSAVYLVWQIPQWISVGWFSPAAFVDWFKASLVSSSYYHMWYILSLIYVIPMMYFLLRHINTKAFSVIMALIYAVGVFLYTFGEQFNITLFTKALGLASAPVVSVLLIMPSVTPCLFIDKIRLSRKSTTALFAVSYVLFAVESILVYFYTDRERNSQYALFIVPTIFFLFLMLKNANLKISKEQSLMLRNMSTLIYFVHPMVINILGLFVSKEHINGILFFAVVSAISVLIGFGLSVLSRKLKKANFLKYFM